MFRSKGEKVPWFRREDARLRKRFWEEELSIRAEKRNGEDEAGQEQGGPSRLMRVRWEGRETSDKLFDPATDIALVIGLCWVAVYPSSVPQDNPNENALTG